MKTPADVNQNSVIDDDFGCERCWPTVTAAAWPEQGALNAREILIDESHFRVGVVSCEACTQSFAWMFTEMIDWEDGDDPQYWTLIPITEAEVDELLRHPESVETRLEALPPQRRSLKRDAPKGAPITVYWSSGILIGPHD